MSTNDIHDAPHGRRSTPNWYLPTIIASGQHPTTPASVRPSTGEVKLFLGCMLFGRWGRLGPLDVERLVDEAFDRGISGFETAAAYGGGESEQLLGRALRGRTATICTKIMAPGDRLEWSPAGVRKAIDASRARLRVDRIDVLLVHRVDDSTPLPAMAEALVSAVDAGSVKVVGTSCMSGDLLVEAQREARAVNLSLEVEQCQYSLLDRSAEASLLPVTQRYGMTPFLYGVLDEGILAEATLLVGSSSGRRPEGNIKVHPWPTAAARACERRRSVARQLREIAGQFDISLIDLALGFVRASAAAFGSPPWVTVGARRHDQIAGICAALDTSWSCELQQAIDALVPPTSSVSIPARSQLRGSLVNALPYEIVPLQVGND